MSWKKEYLRLRRAKLRRKRENQSVYRERDDLLKSLGWRTYLSYLRGPLWKRIREEFLEDHPRCALCSRPATQVHHRRYDRETLLGNDLSHLLALCHRCHKRIEYTRTGKKRRFIAVERYLRTLLKGRRGRN